MLPMRSCVKQLHGSVSMCSTSAFLRSTSSRISSSCPRRKEEAVKIAAVVLQTNTASIYTAEPLDPVMELSNWTGKARQIFSLPTKYMSPSEFNYVYPDANVPEFAFVGRSNVGKSTLVGRLLGDDKMVRTSKLPGCTRSVNFFAFIKGKNSHVAYMVDLPGYGFAKAKKDEKAKWKAFIEGYLRDRTQGVLR